MQSDCYVIYEIGLLFCNHLDKEKGGKKREGSNQDVVSLCLKLALNTCE